MKALWNRIWHGEPAFLFGFINTVLVTLVATGDMAAWLGWAAAVSTALSAFIIRSKVSPSNPAV